MSTMKQCTKCGEVKPTTEYAKRAASSDGLQIQCKTCNKKDNEKFRNSRPLYKREWDAKNPGVQSKITIEWTKNNPEQFYANLKRYHGKWGGGVYKINNLVTGDSYIGSSKALYARMLSHFNCHHKGASNKKLMASMKEYGNQWFSFEVLEKCSEEQLKSREQFFIDLLDPSYNVANAIKQSI